MITWLAVKAFLGKLPWRLIGAGALVLVVALMGWRVSTWRDAYKALPGLEDALAREEACEDGSRCYERQRAFTEAVGHETTRIVTDYEAALAEIRDRPVPDIPVRLCRPRGTGRVSGQPAAPAPDGATAGTDVPVEVGRDIAVELYRLADEADELSLRLRALQDYSRAVSAPPP